MNRKIIFYGFLALLTVGLAWYGVLYWRSRSPKPDVPIAVFGSRQTLTAFLSSADVFAERLHYRGASRQNPWKLDSYDRDTPIALSRDQALTIQQLFAQESTYGWRFNKMSAPNYGVLVTARSDQSTVRVALCFECYVLGVYDSEDGSANCVNRENDFIPHASRTLIKLSKEFFPNDPDIQRLK